MASCAFAITTTRREAAKVMELQATEFLRRFLLHVVPTGFVRIRHYGLLANRTRQAKLARARQLLAIVAATPLLSPVSVPATDTAPSPTAAARCPHCAGTALAQDCPPPAAARAAAMMEFPFPARSTAVPVFTTRDFPHASGWSSCVHRSALWLGWHAVKSPLSFAWPIARLRPSPPLPPPSCSHRQYHHWQGAPDSIESP